MFQSNNRLVSQLLHTDTAMSTLCRLTRRLETFGKGVPFTTMEKVETQFVDICQSLLVEYL